MMLIIQLGDSYICCILRNPYSSSAAKLKYDRKKMVIQLEVREGKNRIRKWEPKLISSELKAEHAQKTGCFACSHCHVGHRNLRNTELIEEENIIDAR